MVTYGFDINNLLKTNRVTKENISKTQQWLITETSIPILSDHQICLFLLACENDFDSTKKCIHCFYTVRKNAPDIFDNRNLDRVDVALQLQTLEFVVIPKRTADNHVIVINRLYDPIASNYHMESAMKLLLMAFDSVLYDNPPDGIIILFDMSKLSISHITRTKIGVVRKVLKYIQDGMPICLKEIHILNVMWFFDKILSVVKPFMYKELTNKLHPHSPELKMEEFYDKHIPKSHLPSDYGGDLQSVKELHALTVKKLKDLSEHFQQEENQRKQHYNKEK